MRASLSAVNVTVLKVPKTVHVALTDLSKIIPRLVHSKTLLSYTYILRIANFETSTKRISVVWLGSVFRLKFGLQLLVH